MLVDEELAGAELEGDLGEGAGAGAGGDCAGAGADYAGAGGVEGGAGEFGEGDFDEGGDFGEGAVGDFFALFEDQHVRADFLEQMEQMGTEDDGRAVAGALQNGVLHAADSERVEAGEWLVEEHDARAVQEAAGDGEFLLHAAGEFAGELVGFVGDFEFLEQRFGEGLVVGDAVDPRDEIQVLADREVVEEARFVGEEGEGALDLYRERSAIGAPNRLTDALEPVSPSHPLLQCAAYMSKLSNARGGKDFSNFCM